MRNPYPRPRRVKPLSAYLVFEPPSAALTPPQPAPTPSFRFELARGSEDIYNNQRDWAGEVQMTVKAENQKAAFEKAEELSGRPANSRYVYIFRVKSVEEI